MQGNGYTTIDVAYPNEAIVKLNQLSTLDLVISDIVMPGVPVSEMIKAIHDRFPGVQTLFVSGYARDESLLNHAIDHLLSKPFDAGDLLDLVETILLQRK